MKPKSPLTRTVDFDSLAKEREKPTEPYPQHLKHSHIQTFNVTYVNVCVLPALVSKATYAHIDPSDNLVDFDGVVTYVIKMK